MWYLIVEGVKLPTPYLTYDDAKKAMDALREQMGPCCMDMVYELFRLINRNNEKPIKSVRGTSLMTTQQPTEMHGAKA